MKEIRLLRNGTGGQKMGRLIDEDTCQYYDGYGDRLDRAIEIVKRGGRDD